MLGVPAVRTLRAGLHLLETEVADFDVRAAVLVGRERAVVFDTLAHPGHLAPVPELVGGLPVTVVYSHADWDHAWGTGALGVVEAVVAHAAAGLRFGADVPAELARRRETDPDRWRDVVLVPPTVTFAERHEVELGGATLELYSLPGHTADCVVGFVPEWGLLLAGDTVETPLPVVNDGRVVSAWVEGLGRWLDDPRVTTVVPSHGRIGGRDVIAETLRYLRDLAAGRDPADPATVAPFYRRTHMENVRRVREAGLSAGS
ncbi:MAG: MBL fold metallo-hydrolase [Gemmatimonadota bacterium]